MTKKSKVADFCYSYELRNYPGVDRVFYDAKEIEDLFCPALVIMCPNIVVIENILEMELNNYAKQGRAYIMGDSIILSPSEYDDLKARFRQLSQEFRNTYGNPHNGRNYS